MLQPAAYAPELSADLGQNKQNFPGAKAPGECQKTFYDFNKTNCTNLKIILATHSTLAEKRNTLHRRLGNRSRRPGGVRRNRYERHRRVQTNRAARARPVREARPVPDQVPKSSWHPDWQYAEDLCELLCRQV